VIGINRSADVYQQFPGILCIAMVTDDHGVNVISITERMALLLLHDPRG
jgi:hypothetical protein